MLLMKKPPWNTGLVCLPVRLCYFKQHALKVQHYNQPITLKTCWSRMPAPSKAPQTSHDSGTEVPGEGLSQRWSKEPVPVTPKPGAQPGQSTMEPELSHENLSQQAERERLALGQQLQGASGQNYSQEPWCLLSSTRLLPLPHSYWHLCWLLQSPSLCQPPHGHQGSLCLGISPFSGECAEDLQAELSVRAEVAQAEWQSWQSWQMVVREINSAPRHWKNHLKKQFTVTMKLLLLEWKC